MASVAENNIFALAQKYNLEQGKFADFYQLHNNWCLTKHGATKIRHAEGISYDVMQSDKTNVSYVIFMEFTNKDGKTVQEIGSCRFDGTKNTPERSHAPEMAFKRCLVRGTIAILGEAAQGVYGDEEFDTDFKKNGNAQPAPQPAPQPVAQPTQNPTVQELNAIARGESAPQPATNPDKTIDYSQDPRLAKARQSTGWQDNYLTLPQEWTQQIDKIQQLADIQPRNLWERRIVDHLSKYLRKKDSKWIGATTNYINGSYGGYQDFACLVFDINTFVGANDSKAGFAVQYKKKLELMIDALASTGQMVLEVPNADGSMLEQHVITKRDNNAPIGEATQQIIEENKGEIAQASPETRFDGVPPKHVDADGNMHDLPF